MADLRAVEGELSTGVSIPQFGDALSLGSQLNLAKVNAERAFQQQWCSGNPKGCALAIASPLFPALAAAAPALAGEAISACALNPAGCTATINSLADGIIADGAVGAAGVYSAKQAVERALAADVSTGIRGVGSSILLEEMAAKGIKFTPENVIQASKLPDGRIAFLELGNSSAGLQHILDRHAVDFSNKGIPVADIPSLVMKAVTEGKGGGTSGSAPVYETFYNGVMQYISVGVSSNGFVVRANPVSTWKPI